MVREAPEKEDGTDMVRIELANRLFFRLYQCANMLHKTGSRALEAEGLTTQQWAVLGALSRPEATGGMTVNELARYLMVSRQNLSGVLQRMERNGHLAGEVDPRDGRARLITLTPSGRDVWEQRARPKIHTYYEQATAGFSVNDLTHSLHYLLQLLDNMTAIDHATAAAEDRAGDR
jgi:DNA-binding MarR family transcriptional regulator